MKMLFGAKRQRTDAAIEKAVPTLSQADIVMHSWDTYFREGGEFNQPSWLSTNKVKKLRNFYARISRLGAPMPAS